jgi:hypothetical protein
MEVGIQFQVQFFKKNSDSDSENHTQFQPVWVNKNQTGIRS